MKHKRVLSALLALVLVLTLLPTAAFAAEEIKTVAVTVSGMEWGKPRPGIGAFSVADPNLQVTNINWTAADDGKVTYNNRVNITVDIKKGVDAKFAKQTSVKTSVNGDSNGIVKKRASDTQFVITYTIKAANPNAAAEQAAIQAAAAVAATRTDVQSYDTFDCYEVPPVNLTKSTKLPYQNMQYIQRHMKGTKTRRYRHWPVCYTRIGYQFMVREEDTITFPTPPADPGTVSGAAAAAATAPAPAKPTTAGGFNDVPAGSYYARAVVWAVEKGVTGGMSAGVFGPNENCTQGQIITFLWRAAGQPAPKGTVNMEGFDSSKYYYKAVQWAAEQGILEGAFDPDAPCTRATAMMYLWINGGRKTSASQNYKDVPRDSPYRQAVDWAAGAKITSGTGDGSTFSPDQVCTRAQIVTFLYRAFNK